MKYFNTSGPCIPEEHYTLNRKTLIKKGQELVVNKRYFTIWAPRQTGKSTYFRLLAEQLRNIDYIAVQLSTEGFNNYSEADLFDTISRQFQAVGFADVRFSRCKDFEKWITENNNAKLAIIIDEIEGLNPAIFNQFLHTIRNLYHSRESHCLKSVIFVGVSNILGIIQDNASPFNIADNLDVPYFTEAEVFELLGQHEIETGQKFAEEVKAKIYEITAGQPGLVNGFAYQLVERNVGKDLITEDEYYQVEDWYLYQAIDKNIENIVSMAKRYRALMEELLFTEKEIKFDLGKEDLRFLSTQGVIKRSNTGSVEFWVPLYRKRLFSTFSPDLNGEGKYFFSKKEQSEYLDAGNNINLIELINNFKDYVQERSFKYFMERQPDGGYERLKEAAAGYAFSTYLESFIRTIRGKVYYESNAGLGRTDMVINFLNKEYILEFKVCSDGFQFRGGKAQVSYYARKRNLTEAYYVVFASERERIKNFLAEGEEIIEGVNVRTFLIWYDEEKDF